MSRNLVGDYILYDKDCLKSYLDIIVQEKLEPGLIDIIVDTYLDVRYYDSYEHIENSLTKTLDYYIKKNVEKYLSNKDLSNNSINKNIRFSVWLMKYLLYFEKATTDKKIVKLLDELEGNLRNKFDSVSDTLKDELFSLIRVNVESKKKFLRKTNCSSFHLELSETNNMYVNLVKLISDVKIPDLFSDIAINRVYNNGIISEDKQLVMLTLVSVLVLKNIINYNYNMEYIVEFDCNLLLKRNKLRNLFKIIDLDLLKNKISFKINYKDFLDNKDGICSLINEGYRFAVFIDNKYDDNKQILDIFSFIIINDKILEEFDDYENIIVRKK